MRGAGRAVCWSLLVWEGWTAVHTPPSPAAARNGSFRASGYHRRTVTGPRAPRRAPGPAFRPRPARPDLHRAPRGHARSGPAPIPHRTRIAMTIAAKFEIEYLQYLGPDGKLSGKQIGRAHV